MGNLTQFGEVTKSIFLNDISAHVLHLAFVVATGVTIKKGMPVKLNATGQVTTVVGDGTDAHQIIGYSIMDGVAGDYVTVGTKGIGVVWAKAKTALTPGAVFYAGLDSVETEYSAYDDTAVTAALMNGWALDVAAAEHDPIRVLLAN